MPITRNLLFIACFAICSWSILWRIADFPLFFFCDEAVFAAVAKEWISNGWQDNNGKLLPLYYDIAMGRHVPMFSSYILGLGSFLFEQTPATVRSLNAIIPLLGVIAASVYAKLFLSARIWWLTPLIFASIPVWYLFTRTAFDVPVSIGLLSITLLFYCLYRLKSANYIYPLVLSASAFFYTYASSQLVLPLIAIALLFTDFKYHWQNRKKLLLPVILAAVLLIPAILFTFGSGAGFNGQFVALDSFAIKEITLSEKLSIFFHNYYDAINPYYWLSPDSNELIRHRLLGRGHFPVMFVPFLLTGLLVSICRISNPVYRCILICAVMIPVPVGIFNLNITRILTLTVPFTLWTVIGLDFLLSKLKHATFLVLPAALMLGIYSVNMSLDAVKNGATWYDDYGLYGLQYGTRQIFEQSVPEIFKQHPEATIHISPDFANDPTALLNFFIPEKQRSKVLISQPDPMKFNHISKDDVFIMETYKYQQIIDSGKFKTPVILGSLAYPNGQTGFYYLKLEHIDNIHEVLAAEKEARKKPLETRLIVNGQPALVRYSRLDMGEPGNIFDHDILTLARGLEDNPFMLEIELEQPIKISKLGISFGWSYTETDLTIISPDLRETKNRIVVDATNQIDQTWIEIPSQLAKTIKLKINSPHSIGDDHLHIFDLRFE